MKLLLATHNKSKIKELGYLLQDCDINILSFNDFNFTEAEETGKTFEENALIKAKQAGLESGILSLSDDSGFEIEAIGGQPSIYSARWAYNGDFSKAFETIKILLDGANDKLLAQKLSPNYNAKFVCVLCLYNPLDNYHRFFKGEIEGYVSFPPRGENGFAYDKIFIPKGYNKTFAEMSFVEKNLIAHRSIALKKLKNYFKENSFA